jgi:pimeloyl-ACP methyl ester carboxylesterase
MHGELVTTQTSDGVRLNGFFLERQQAPLTSVDGAVIMHGLAGNFYGSALLLNIARQLADSGIQTVVGNSRGHDLLNLTIRNGRSQTSGAAVEDVAEGPADLLGWVEFLRRRQCERVLLVGHSLGAIKSLLTISAATSPQVIGVAALSPTRLNHAQFAQSRSGPLFLETLAAARELCDRGKPHELMRIQFPFPTLMAAQAYLDKYGPGNRFDWLGWVEQIRLPTLVLFGELELNENPAFEGLRFELERALTGHPLVEWQEVPGADHFYSATVLVAAERLLTWMSRTF